MATTPGDVVVVGAGIAGVAAASRLAQAGCSVTVVEGQAQVGGRMAARSISGVTVDHGAQFFTTRSPEFSGLVEAAAQAGAVTVWSRGFQVPDPYPRYRGTGAMTDLVTWMARDLTVELGRPLRSLDEFAGADAVVLTPPVPESLGLLAASNLLPHPDLAGDLGRLAYKPTVTALVVLGAPSGLDPPGGWQYTDHPHLAFVADNHLKGVADRPAVTVHLSNELSGEVWDKPDGDVLDRTLDLVATHLGGAPVVHAEIHRWRYAGPVEVWPQRTVVWGRDPIVALGGEIFGGPKVEGAYLSGLAAADAVLARIA